MWNPYLHRYNSLYCIQETVQPVCMLAYVIFTKGFKPTNRSTWKVNKDAEQHSRTPISLPLSLNKPNVRCNLMSRTSTRNLYQKITAIKNPAVAGKELLRIEDIIMAWPVQQGHMGPAPSRSIAHACSVASCRSTPRRLILEARVREEVILVGLEGSGAR